jgi:hypothetical protein
VFSHQLTCRHQLNSPQLCRAAERYAEAAARTTGAPFWRRKAASQNLEIRRREYVVELIRAAEVLRLKAL